MAPHRGQLLRLAAIVICRSVSSRRGGEGRARFPARLEASSDHLGDGALGEFFIPLGQRSAVQIREALRVGGQRFHLGSRLPSRQSVARGSHRKTNVAETDRR
jgi:hypothetical protein